MSCELQGKNEQADDNYKLQTTNGNIETHPFQPFIPKGIKYLRSKSVYQKHSELEETGTQQTSATNKLKKFTYKCNQIVMVWF